MVFVDFASVAPSYKYSNKSVFGRGFLARMGMKIPEW
jgi:hypothetical protein